MAIPNPQPNIIDTIKSDNTTWSSNKINSEISSGTGDMIDDASITDAKTWSSYKINQEIPKELDHLLDVTITEPASGDTLVYNEISEKFENDKMSLNNLNDVSLNSVTAGETLVYNSTAQAFQNKDLVWVGTQAAYDLLTPDPDVVYIIIPST